jgi:hypothetical protein
MRARAGEGAISWPWLEARSQKLPFPVTAACTSGMEFAILPLPFRILSGGTIVYQTKERSGEHASPLGPRA